MNTESSNYAQQYKRLEEMVNQTDQGLGVGDVDQLIPLYKEAVLIEQGLEGRLKEIEALMGGNDKEQSDNNG